ncbi:MAG TPA: NAD(P)/FAD-dependent oxidoreductase [Verrucomicrobiae bacterium]|jgi:NADH dehydrogenase|nr:NAD(P)/FAD-dependent oxidoreductase [Verrucomicrobiae bacterium]
MAEDAKPHIVVLGAGFGGLEFCKNFRSPDVRITLVDRTNHHLFQPLLYQVATAGLSAPDIAQPIRSILTEHTNTTVLLDQVVDIKLDAKKVFLEEKVLEYDYLILALGGRTSYFGHPEWEQFAPGLKSLADAVHIRSNILLAFERAEIETEPDHQQRLMTIVVVGGGPTGVELAGAFAELARRVLVTDFRHVDPSQAHILLLEAESRILAHMSPELSENALHQLEKLGVQVRLKTKVKNISEGRIELENGETIFAANIVWAAGVSASPLMKKLGVELDKGDRIKVNPDLSVPGHPEVFAVGDVTLILDENGKPVPGVSPAAMQMARHAAQIIQHEINFSGEGARPPFKYWDKGTMSTIGRSAAVAQIGKLEFTGFIAWLAWLGVHLLFLIGFRNKIAVLIQWFYSYVTYKRGARIISTEANHKFPKDKNDVPAQP